MHHTFNGPVRKHVRVAAQQLVRQDVDHAIEVEQIPILGTGKLDLKGAQTLALELSGLPTG